MNTFFWILWWIVVTGTIVFYYFFLVGLADGSVSSFNAKIWSLIVIGLPAILVGSYLLRSKGMNKLAWLLISVPSWPMIGYLLFVIMMVFFGPKRWN